MVNEKDKKRKYASSLRFIASYLLQKYKGKLNTGAGKKRKSSCPLQLGRSSKSRL
jgi:hypothetical protein